MKLKTRLLLATTLTVLVILGASESLNYFNLAAFVNGHEAAMARVGDHASMMASLERAKYHLFRRLIWLHVTHACLTILGLVIVLHVLWWRLFLRPLECLLKHIHSMGLGSWIDPIPVDRSDEIGDLIRAFNALGDQLTASVQQVAVTSRLSALALLGGRVVRKATLVRDHVRSIELMLDAARQEGGTIPESVGFNLMRVGADLERITDEFEMMFAHEFDSHSVRPSVTKGRTVSLGHDPVDEPGIPALFEAVELESHRRRLI